MWGPEHSMWACCMEGARKAATHCSITAGSHSWWLTDLARFPTFWPSARLETTQVCGAPAVHLVAARIDVVGEGRACLEVNTPSTHVTRGVGCRPVVEGIDAGESWACVSVRCVGM